MDLPLNMLLSLIVLGLTMGLPQQEVPRDPYALQRFAQLRIASSLAHLPRYMCTETTERSTYTPAKAHKNACKESRDQLDSHLVTSDRVRIDVARGENNEMYSWVGEKRFSDASLLQLVREGTIANGYFGNFLKAIFVSGIATLSYKGNHAAGGRTVAEYGYNVSREKTAYSVGVRNMYLVAYGGTFQIDTQTGDLLHLVVKTENLPSETGSCEVTQTFDYATQRFRDIDFVLPKEIRLHGLSITGEESENRTAFTSCQEFLGESTVSFGDPSEASRAVAGPAQTEPRVVNRAGLQFRVKLTQSVDTSTAAVGDIVQGKLVTPIGDRDKALAPEGAAIRARITQLKRVYGQNPTLAFSIRLESVEIDGAAVRLPAIPDSGQVRRQGGATSIQFIGNLRSILDTSKFFQFPAVQQPYVIPEGLESDWFTWH